LVDNLPAVYNPIFIQDIQCGVGPFSRKKTICQNVFPV
jgi:hypothetical protein